jgi:hypothetical protein
MWPVVLLQRCSTLSHSCRHATAPSKEQQKKLQELYHCEDMCM